MSKSKYTRSFQKEILKKGEFVKHRILKKQAYKNMSFDNIDPSVVDDETGAVYNHSDFKPMKNHHDEDRDCSARLHRTRYRASLRIYSRINLMLKKTGEVHWNTHTFDDYWDDHTTPLERETIMIEFCKSYGVDYVLSVDYGTREEYESYKGDLRIATGREHFHVLCSGKVDMKAWKYGEQTFSTIINTTNDDKKRLSNYLASASVEAREHCPYMNKLKYSHISKLRKPNTPPLISITSTQTQNELNQPKTIPFYNIQYWINNINSNKQYPIYHDMY